MEFSILKEREEAVIEKYTRISSRDAQRLVNTELVKKVGQMIMAGEPELQGGGVKPVWKIPFLVVPPDDDPQAYPTGEYAYVDVESCFYSMSEREINAIREASRPILHRLYPDLADWLREVEKARE